MFLFLYSIGRGRTSGDLPCWGDERLVDCPGETQCPSYMSLIVDLDR